MTSTALDVLYRSNC